MFVRLLILEIDSRLISPYSTPAESHIKVMRIKEMITILKMLLIVMQILLVSSIENVQNSMENILTEMLGCKVFSKLKTGQEKKTSIKI